MRISQFSGIFGFFQWKLDFGGEARRGAVSEGFKNKRRSRSPLAVVQVAAVAGVAPQPQLACFVERATRDLKVWNEKFPESQVNYTHIYIVIVIVISLNIFSQMTNALLCMYIHVFIYVCIYF